MPKSIHIGTSHTQDNHRTIEIYHKLWFFVGFYRISTLLSDTLFPLFHKTPFLASKSSRNHTLKPEKIELMSHEIEVRKKFSAHKIAKLCSPLQRRGAELVRTRRYTMGTSRQVHKNENERKTIFQGSITFQRAEIKTTYKRHEWMV